MNLQLVRVIFASVCIFVASADRFPLSIVHINDFHARFEATGDYGGFCSGDEVCIGGYARTLYTVKRLLKEHADHNPIYLNAGDNFQGTLWYSLGRWQVTSQFLNMLPADAMTLGNHEFDHGIAGVVPFIESVQTPVLVANMDASKEPTLDGKFQKSMIIERGGRKIGIVGIILETTDQLSSTEKLVFTNETEALRQEAAKLRAQGANIIIALTHCGYDVDLEIAKYANTDVDVIVGAHSHTFLYTGTPPANYPGTPLGDYPTVVQDASGHRVLIVQAASYARYVGNIRVYFDDNGEILDWEGEPIFMSADVPEDEEVKAALLPWKEQIDAQGNVILGSSKVPLSAAECYTNECNGGNFICDAMIYTMLQSWSYENDNWAETAIAISNPGGIRSSISAGEITFSHLVTMSPFENVLVSLEVTGEKLIEALEKGVQGNSRSILQASGLRVTYDLQQPDGNRVVDVLVRCANCTVPRYEPIDKTKVYRVGMADFLSNGGDGFDMFSNYGTNRKVYAAKDIDSITQYVEANSPIITGVEKRIAFIN